MKHLKVYENYNDKMMSKNKFNNMINEYIPGYYMIYKSNTYHWKENKYHEFIALCRIITPEVFDEGDIRLKIDILSYVCELDQNELRENEKIKTGKQMINPNHSSFERIFLSSSLKNTQDKFEELKKSICYQWELNKATNKFNI